MNHRAEYLLQVLEKIGAPLLAAVGRSAARASENAPALEAQKMAELLAKTVQAGIEIGYVLDLGPTGEMNDPIRLALTGVAAPLVAGVYESTGRVPAEADIRKIVAALQAALTFAENFQADEHHTGRLKGLPADIAQKNAQYLHAFAPVISSVATFSFGQPEPKLILDISARLNADARRLRTAGNIESENGALRALGLLYASSHAAETARILALPEQQRAGQNAASGAMENVWKAYELRLGMLEVLAAGIAGGATGGGADGPGMKAGTPDDESSAREAPPPVSDNPLSMFSKKPPGAGGPPQPPSSTPSSSPPPTSGPMSFFKKPPPDEN